MTKQQLNSISEATLKRLPQYYRELVDIKNENKEYVSCTAISSRTGQKPITVRKDLQKAGAIGKPKVGYATDEIINLLVDVLGLNNNNQAVLVGAGNLGNALLGYNGFDKCGLSIAAAFDIDNSKVDEKLNGKQILSVDELEEVIKKSNIKIGIITTPPNYAQKTADTMIKSGITGIWNFSSTTIDVPDFVIIENVDLSTSLSVLMTKMTGH